MTEYIVQTKQGRNISYHGENKADAKRKATQYGNIVVDVLTMEEYDRYTDKLLGIGKHNAEITYHIEKGVA